MRRVDIITVGLFSGLPLDAFFPESRKASRTVRKVFTADNATMRDAGSPFNAEKRPQLSLRPVSLVL
jgi:hypothetical protein